MLRILRGKKDQGVGEQLFITDDIFIERLLRVLKIDIVEKANKDLLLYVRKV
jgi:hypothetical protein